MRGQDWVGLEKVVIIPGGLAIFRSGGRIVMVLENINKNLFPSRASFWLMRDYAVVTGQEFETGADGISI